MSVPAYFDRVNEELLKLLPPACGRVVELGCGAGAMGRDYKQSHPATDYIGIESHSDAAAIAATRLNRVIVGDVEHLTEAEFAIEYDSVDCLVYGDVLEHLVDPWAVLVRHARWLKPGGRVLASIPNVQHWTMLGRLLTDRWIYESEGLMDRTHLRFFSLNTILHLFQQAGLQVELVNANQSLPSESQRLELQPLMAAIAALAPDYPQRCLNYQYLIRAWKPPH